MEILDSSFIYKFISQFLFPMVQSLIFIMVLFFVLDPEYYSIKSIIRKEGKYILYKKMYIPNYITPYGKIILFLYDKFKNFPLYMLFTFIVFSHILNRIIIELNRFLPPHVSTSIIMPTADYDTIGRIWCHYPEINNYYDFTSKLISLRNTLNIEWQKSLTILSSHTYFKIQTICKFSLVIVIIAYLFSKAVKINKKLFRSFIMSLIIVIFYFGSVFLYVKSISYEQNLHYKQILNLLDEQDPIQYKSEDLENYINIIEIYSSETSKFNIRFK